MINSTLNSVGIGTAVAATGTANLGAQLGTDATSGISWGRWDGGSVNIKDRVTGVTTVHSLGASSLHWLAGPAMTGPVTLPVSGTFTYVLAGGTAPTDNLGNIGTLNSATLTANFTTQTVDVGVNATVNAVNYIANGAGVPIQNGTHFGTGNNGNMSGGGTFTASCSACGAFTGAGATGAGVIYGFQNGTTVVNGVAAFHR